MHSYRVFAVLTAIALTACADDEKAQPKPASEAAKSAPAPVVASAPRPATTEKCGTFTPHFAYNSDEPSPDDEQRLGQLAQCLKVTLGEREAVTLVGRADERGSELYNYWLGMRRAQQVREIFVDQGMAANQIKLRSAGKQGARGHLDGHSYAEDRRVDVVANGSAT